MPSDVTGGRDQQAAGSLPYEKQSEMAFYEAGMSITLCGQLPEQCWAALCLAPIGMFCLAGNHPLLCIQ